MKEPTLFKDASLLTSTLRNEVVFSPVQIQKSYFDEIKAGLGNGRYQYHFKAAEGSSLDVVLLQNAGEAESVSIEILIEAAAHAKVRFTFIQEGAARSEMKVTTLAEGSGSDIEIRGLQNAKRKQKHEVKVSSVHSVPHTKSDLKVWCIAQDESQSIFNAIADIKKEAPFTEAHQKNKNLILSEKATIDTFPKLMIANSEVKCTHGSSTSTLEPEQYYYLQSRGISKDQASQMIVSGFMNQALEMVTESFAKNRLTQVLGLETESEFT